MYHSLSVADAVSNLKSNIQGLDDSQIEDRRSQYGFNELPVKKKSLLLVFFRQFHDVLIYILFGALALSIVTPFFEGHAITAASFLDAYVIAAILILNAGLGFLQEWRAEKAIDELAKLTSPTARVRRNNIEMRIPSRELLPGDILIIEAGDKLSADGRVLSESHLKVNESSLTGESHDIDKTHEPITEEVGISGMRNMVFSGTTVTRGSAEVLITSIGTHTEIGKIAKLVSETTLPETPLERRMHALGRLLGTVVIILCFIVIAVGLMQGLPLIEVLLIGVSLAVSAVPEGLPAVVTVCLAMGVRRMVSKHAIVRRLDALETLGSVTIICADKTGTITENKMKVIETWLPDESKQDLHTEILASCNRAVLPNLGDPMEVGLLKYAEEQNVHRKHIDDEEVPFSSEDKYMQTRHGEVSYIKGAPEVVLSMCDGVNEQDVLHANERMAEQGLRVLATATSFKGKVEFIGLVGMEDPAREGVDRAVKEAAAAGIRSIMITGDNIITARSIASQVGIEGESLLGKDIDELSDEELSEKLKTVSVIARVSPEHKLTILRCLMSQGHIVSMSGDGVNDAPALKGAHVGLAMGKEGTEVAREASSIVLADDNYKTIVAAIKEGRRIYDNIRKFVLFLLRANFDELLFIVTAMLIGIPLPYLPVHILWINLMTDGLPALALGMEKAEPDIMKKPPRDPNEHILEGEWTRLVILGVYGFLATFVYYYYQISSGVAPEVARTTTVTVAVFFELLLAFSARSKKPLWEIGIFSNKWMNGAICVPLIIHLVVLFSPAASILRFTTIEPGEWFNIISIVIGSFLFFEAIKLFGKKKTY